MAMLLALTLRCVLRNCMQLHMCILVIILDASARYAPSHCTKLDSLQTRQVFCTMIVLHWFGFVLKLEVRFWSVGLCIIKISQNFIKLENVFFEASGNGSGRQLS